jgi:hypothetical protein
MHRQLVGCPYSHMERQREDEEWSRQHALPDGGVSLQPHGETERRRRVEPSACTASWWGVLSHMETQREDEEWSRQHALLCTPAHHEPPPPSACGVLPLTRTCASVTPPLPSMVAAVLYVPSCDTLVPRRFPHPGAQCRSQMNEPRTDPRSELHRSTPHQTAMQRMRIVTLRVGTGRQNMVPERWTNPELSRRT